MVTAADLEPKCGGVLARPPAAPRLLRARTLPPQFTARLTRAAGGGVGDPDVYVRAGRPPTAHLYDARASGRLADRGLDAEAVVTSGAGCG